MRTKNIITFLTLSILTTISLCPLAWASSIEDRAKYLMSEGQKYYWGRGVGKDLKKALSLYLEAARLGNQDAQYIAGGMYYRGMGTPKDNSKAFQLLFGAAEKGKSTPESQKLLGDFFLQGEFIPQNFTKAVKWYKEAARNGDSDAQVELAFLYYTGQGVNQDFKKSYYWFDKAAHQGVAAAQYSLGVLWFTGMGVESPDSMMAYTWLSVAAANRHPDASNARDFVSQGFNTEELLKAQDLATDLFVKLQEEKSK